MMPDINGTGSGEGACASAAQSVEILLRATSTQQVFTIGRDRKCDVCLAHPTVSTHHADLIYMAPRGYRPSIRLVAHDAGSGIYVDGIPEKSTLVSLESTIQISIYRLRVEATDQGILVHILQNGDFYQIEAHDLSFAAGRTPIIQRIDLVVKPGELVGLYGPSGSGKSTLLNMMSGYRRPSQGRVFVGGLPFFEHYQLLKTFIGHVPQQDLVYPSLTVDESFHYAAGLRLPADTAPAQVEAQIENTLHQLGIDELRAQRVASLSGGQRKRVSIGVELLTNPRILLMDEPEAGLDPYSQEQLITQFKTFSRAGNSVVVVSHTMQSFKRFDLVGIVARGHLVYFGPPEKACTFFRQFGANNGDPTEIYRVLEAGGKGVEHQQKLAAEIAQHYVTSPDFEDYVKRRRATPTVEGQADDGRKEAPSRATAAGFNFRQWGILTSRQVRLRFSRPRDIALYAMIPLVILCILLGLRTRGFEELLEAAPAQRRVVDRIGELQKAPAGASEPEAKPTGKAAEKTKGGGADLARQRAALEAEAKALKAAPEKQFDLATCRLALKTKIPHTILLTLVLTAIFSGIFLACTEISQEWPIYQREHLVAVEIASYLLAKLPFLFGITLVQMTALAVGAVVMKQVAGVALWHVVPLLALSAWASAALGLFLSSLDRTEKGSGSVLMAIVAIIPQIIFSGAIGPDFYGNMHKVSKALSTVFVSRWGFEGLARVFNSDQVIPWGPEVVKHQLMFPGGPTAIWWCYAALAGLTTVFLFLTGISLLVRDLQQRRGSSS